MLRASYGFLIIFQTCIIPPLLGKHPSIPVRSKDPVQGRSDLLEIGRSGRLGLWEAQRIDIFVAHPVGRSDMVSCEKPPTKRRF